MTNIFKNLKSVTNKTDALTSAAQKRVNSFVNQTDCAFYDLYRSFEQFDIHKTSDIVAGDVIFWIEPVFSGSYRNARFEGYEYKTGRVEKDSYGSTGQHTFTIFDFDKKATIRKKGRTVYKTFCVCLKKAADHDVKRDEKHSRADRAKKVALQAWLNSHDPSHPRYAEKYDRLRVMS